jgi:DNA-binding CsgD family transcriptional regulator
MRSSAALKQLRLVASRGLPSQQSIPLMLELVEEAIPCCFANFFWLDGCVPVDIYLPMVIPTALDAFIGNQRKLMESPDEPSIDKYVRLGLKVGAAQALTPDRGTFRRSILYNEVYRVYGIEDALDLTIRERGQAKGMLLINRDRARWSPAEIRLLLAMESHFLAALCAPVRAGGTGAGEPEQSAYLLCDASGDIHLAAGDAAILLSQFMDMPVRAGVRVSDLVRRLPPPLMKLIERLALIGAGRAAPAARDVRATRWGEFTAQALRAEWLDHAESGSDRYVLVLEKRLTRAALVTRNAGRLRLAPKEREIAADVGMEVPFAEIAVRHGLSRSTLRGYLKDIYGRTGTAGRDQLAALLTSSGRINAS